jgi:hypothetical protein
LPVWFTFVTAVNYARKRFMSWSLGLLESLIGSKECLMKKKS